MLGGRHEVTLPHDRCPKHGPQIVGLLCGHAYQAVQALDGIEVYLHYDREWLTLCESCVRRLCDRRDFEIEFEPGCPCCLKEWADTTGSDYFARAVDPKNEFPDDARVSASEQ